MDLNSTDSHWYFYNASFTPDREANYTYRIYARDNSSNGNGNTSSLYTLPIFYDWTWSYAPNSLSAGAPPGTNTSLVAITINTTGDKNLSFKINSNYDYEKMFYNGTPATVAGDSPDYDIPVGTSLTIEVNATARIQSGTTDVILRIQSLNASATPYLNYTNGTFVSCNETICLFTSFTYSPASVTVGDTNVNVSAKVSNFGNQTATDVNLTATLPDGWSSLSPTFISICLLYTSPSPRDS